ncbi:MAG TPA: hypothetical protein VIY53_07215 [Acidobacteriaceae bacterium]
MTTIATGGSAAWDEFFTPESHAAITAVTGFHADFGLIDKHSLL